MSAQAKKAFVLTTLGILVLAAALAAFLVPIPARSGTATSHHAFLLGQMLTQLDQLAALIARCDVRILEVSKPFEPEIQRLQTIVGVGRRSAEVLVSEIGVDMSRFSTAGHLASWARNSDASASAADRNGPGPPFVMGRRLLGATQGASLSPANRT